MENRRLFLSPRRGLISVYELHRERLGLSNVVAIIYARDEGVTGALSSIFDDHIPQMHTI